MAFATAVVVYGPEHFINGLDGKRSTEFLTENGFLGKD